MWDNTIGKQISRANRNLLLFNGFALLLILAFIAISARATANLIFGPFNITNEELVKIEDPTKRWQYNIRVKGIALTKPIYEEFEFYRDKNTGEEERKTITALYQLLLVDKSHFMLVNGGASGASDANLRGALVRVPSDLQTNILDKMSPAIRGNVLPMMLDTTKLGSFDFFSPIIMFAVLALAVWNLNKLRLRRDDITLHPIHKTLSRYGRPEEVAPEIENEIRLAGKPAFPITITKNWMYYPTTFNANLQKLDDVVWAYLQQTSHSVNFVPTGKSFRGIVYFSDGRMMDMSASKAVVEQMLATVAMRVPWAYLGYTDELSKHWNKNKNLMIEAAAKAKVDFENQQKKGSDDPN